MNESRRMDEESRRVIREELLTNILVEAGAGSGKTQMLAERMASGVAEGVHQIEQMAAVTFTRKAASELRGRLHLALERELEEAKGSEQGASSDCGRIARIQAALSNIERFFAGTIHAFCARLLRERPVEAGVSPGFSELDEIQDFDLRRRVWREFIASVRASGDPDMMALLEADVRPKDLDSAFATICTNDDVEFPPGETECPLSEAPRKLLESFWRELQKHLPSQIDPETTCGIQKAARQFEAQLRVSRYRLDRPSVIASLLDTWDCDSKIVQKWWADCAPEKKRLRDLVQDLHADFHARVVAPYLAYWRQYVYRVSVRLLTRARAAAAAERRRLNSLNYGDLLHLTARVLRENLPVRRALQKKFQYLLVDEFQDTDPIQAEILFWLAEDGSKSSASGDPATDWRKVPLRPGALFVVGDPKQSIYRFRRADIDIYNIVHQRFEDPSVGLVLPLTLNFRSVPSLCEWANQVFQTRFPAKSTAYAPAFAPLDAAQKDSRSDGVFALTHRCAVAELQNQDAAAIAAYIRSEVEAGRRHFSDFLILTRKKRDRIAPYARALEALDIPVEVSGAGAFGSSPQVATLVGLLRALADPRDSVVLVAVLRGPLFGISDPELFAFKQAGGWFTFFHEPTADAETRSRVDVALSALRQYYRWTRVLPAAGALGRILEHSGYMALAATTPGGSAAGDLLHAIDRVRQVVEQGGSLTEAADALEADSEAASDVESLPLEPGRTDVVRLMNLHKAKGLESDVVFLADPGGGIMSRVDVHVERAGLRSQGWLKIVRMSEGSFSPEVIGEHAEWAQREAAEIPYLQAEIERLLYVAATRARGMLVVSRSTERLRSPAWGALNDFLGKATDLVIPALEPRLAVVPLACTHDAMVSASESQGLAHQSVRQASWTISSVTAEAKHIARATRFLDARDDDPSKVVSTDTPSHRADVGHAWGTLIHGLLEHAMRHRNTSPEDLQRLGLWLTVDEPQLREVLDGAVKTVMQVARADFWTEANAAEHAVESPFAIVTDSNAILTGVIDLMFQQDGGIRIVDYKTHLDLGKHPNAYDEQLKMYESAVSALGISRVSSEIRPVRESK